MGSVTKPHIWLLPARNIDRGSSVLTTLLYQLACICLQLFIIIACGKINYKGNL